MGDAIVDAVAHLHAALDLLNSATMNCAPIVSGKGTIGRLAELSTRACAGLPLFTEQGDGRDGSRPEGAAEEPHRQEKSRRAMAGQPGEASC